MDKVAQEVAESEFERFAESMDLDIDPKDLDSEDLNALEKQKRRITRAIQKGALIISDDGEAVYTPQNAKSKHQEAITFHERTGKSLLAMDGIKKNMDAKKTYSVMSQMCATHPSTFVNLVGVDIKVCEALFALLMD